MDSREPLKLFNLIKECFPDVDFHRQKLDEGDYATDLVLVERKTVSDFYGSIMGSKGKPGRLPSQVERLSTHEDKIVLFLIVGSVRDFIVDRANRDIMVDPSIIYAEVASLMARERFHVLWCPNELDARISMVQFMKAVENGKYGVPARRDPDKLMARILRITPSQYIELKSLFGSPTNIAKQPAKDLMRVQGIGKARAAFIKDLLLIGW